MESSQLIDRSSADVFRPWAMLETALRKKAAPLYQDQDDAGDPDAKEARKRVEDLVSASPEILCLLAEPWLEDMAPGGQAWRLLEACAAIHLYSRVLDDAVDENSHCQRMALLRAQPLLWEAIFGLGALRPDLASSSLKLIRETIDAVIANDMRDSVVWWGRKNHHLLLIPLVLSSDAAAFAKWRSPLGSALALLQSWDELTQGSSVPDRAYAELVSSAMRETLFLARNGWAALATRLCSAGGLILDALEGKIVPRQ